MIYLLFLLMRIVVKGVLLLAVIGITGWLLWSYQNGQVKAPVEDDLPVETVQDAMHLVNQDWIAFETPKELVEPYYELEMQLLDRFDRIDVHWEHAATEGKDEHSLRQFQAGNSSANYVISLRNGNVLPGANTYTVIGYQGDEGSTRQKDVSFELSFDVESLMEENPEAITFPDLPDEVDGDTVVLDGLLEYGGETVQVTSYNPRSEKATFTVLNQYEAGQQSFVYNAEERYDNLSSGENIYIFELYDEEDVLMSRRVVRLKSTKLSLSDEVKVMFGSFEKAEGGWFSSTEKPWFSLRPAYQSVYYETSEQNVVLPRPTLMYSGQEDRGTKLCDYLGGLDYEEEGLIYKGYSYETCQQYGRGVSVYDRFLSALKTTPVLTVPRTQYQDLSEMVSSAFVMIETGGMPEPVTEDGEEVMEEELEQDEVVVEESEESSDEETEEEEEPRYYVYQMLITEDVEYPEKKIGEIVDEMTEERREEIESVRAFLSQHDGDELFTNLLYE